MRKCENCFFCSTNAIFEVKMKFFWCALQIFWYAGKNFFIAKYKLLPPYGASFATFWLKFCSVLQEKNLEHAVQTFAA
jgi:hypothetical protein